MHNDLLTRIESYCARRGISETHFGWIAVRNKRLVYRLRKGEDIKTRTREKILTFLRKSEKSLEAAE